MAQKITSLQRIRGIGANFSAVLVREVLYRSSANRRQLASYVGVALVPYQSGGMDRDRSISRRESAGTYDPHSARLFVAALPAGQRARCLVPGARWHAAGAHAADRRRRAGEEVADCIVALRGSRSAAGGRRDQDRNSARRVRRTGLLQTAHHRCGDTESVTVFFFGGFVPPRFR
jgi:hypothetical protein